MHRYQAIRRGRAAGFNVDLAQRLHAELLRRGLDRADALWAVSDASGAGIFGARPRGVFGRNGWAR